MAPMLHARTRNNAQNIGLRSQEGCGEELQEGEMGDEEAVSREPAIEVQLSTVTNTTRARVRYDFKSGQYVPLPDEELVEDLLTLPSKTIRKEELRRLEDKRRLKAAKDATKVKTQEEKDFEGVISKEELRKLDSQPNPFNFSDRVTQTTKLVIREISIQTEPPPSTSFSANVGLCDIYDAYQADYERVLQKEREKELEKEKDKERGVKPKPVQTPQLTRSEDKMESEILYGEEIKNMKKLAITARTLERMVSQNIYDEITQDFKYWEDGSDEFRPQEGSLLPLWRFNHETSRSLIVSSVSWSPIYHDLFAAAYRSCDISSDEGHGMVCLFTLKNPLAPERIVLSDAGVTSVQFHPWMPSVLCVGRTDGTVLVYDVRSASNPVEIKATAVSGKHVLPVCQVHWIRTEPGEELSFFSVSMDGRVTQWYVHASTLVYTDLLDFSLQPQSGNSGLSSSSDKVTLEGCGTCIAFKPDDESVVLIGCDTGALFECTTAATTHDLTKYDAHSAPIRAVKWNQFNTKVFASCSLDWTIKVWTEYFLSPLVVLDIGGPVAGIDWSPSSSTVLVATTDEGKVNVFDLFMSKCRPLCVQNVVLKRKLNLTALAFSPYYPVILIGGNKGYLVTFKLSPNLRKMHKDAKGCDEQRQKEVEIAKMNRLIAISRAQI